MEELAATRRPILNLPLGSGMVDVGGLPGMGRAGDLPADDEEMEIPPSLIDLFPDLGVYSGPVPPDDDKVHRRLDEGYTSGHRIAHTSRIMDIRPILVSSIQPAARPGSDSWELHDGLWYEDPKGSTEISAEILATTSSVFDGRKKVAPDVKIASSHPAPSAPHFRPQHIWTEDEDQRLRRLIRTYPFNWQLIADTLNSELIFIPTDQPSAYDCWDRWYWQWGEGQGKPRSETQIAHPTEVAPSSANLLSSVLASASQSAAGPPGPVTAVPQSGNTVSGASRPGQTPQRSAAAENALPANPPSAAVSESALQEGQGPPPPGTARRDRQPNKNKYEGSKKAIRHQVVYDTLRRVARRREQSKQKTSGERS